jgi:hypothetical protein
MTYLSIRAIMTRDHLNKWLYHSDIFVYLKMTFEHGLA